MWQALTLLNVFCLLLIRSRGESCLSPMEEGAPLELVCGTSTPVNQSFGLQVKRDGYFETVTSCNLTGTCMSYNSNYEATFSQEEKTDPTTGEIKRTYYSYITIVKVNRSEHTFRCYYDDTDTKVCTAETYVKPMKPSCDNPVLSSSGKQLSLSCTTDQVYPKAGCIFSSEDPPNNYTVPVDYNNFKSPINPDEISTRCVGHIPVNTLTKGQYQFKVFMYADVENGPTTSSIESDLTSQVELSFPRIVIASDCPVGPGVQNGFIEKGTAATCKCELTYNGTPPGHTQWYTSDGIAVGTRNPDGSATLMIEYEPSDPRPKYECHAVSHLKGNQTHAFFSPSFSDLPDADKNKDDDNESLTIGLAVGLSILGVAVIAVVIAAVCLYRHRKTPPATRNPAYIGPSPVANESHYYSRPAPTCHHPMPQPPPYEGPEPGATGFYDNPAGDYIEPVDTAYVDVEPKNGTVSYEAS